LKQRNPAYADVQIREDPADFNLPSTSDQADGFVVPYGIDVSLPSSSKVRPSTLPSDLSDAASSNHANSQREDDETMRHLPRDQDGNVHIQVVSSVVPDSPESAQSRDGLLAEHERMERLMVSDSRLFGNEYDEDTWIKAFPSLFPFGR